MKLNLTIISSFGAMLGLFAGTCQTLAASTTVTTMPAAQQSWARITSNSGGQIHYDPSKCSTNPRGMVYFAVGQRVYRQPPSNIYFIEDYVEPPEKQTHHPLPPDPSEPTGCPGHPIQAYAYYMIKFSIMPEDHHQSISSYADQIGIFVANNPGPSLDDTELFDMMCKTYSLRDTTKPGLLGCQKPFKCSNGITYQAQDYKLPNGKPMTFYCDVGVNCEAPIYCDVPYKLYANMAVDYQFFATKVPVHKIIDYDRELRFRIEAAEVKNYPWVDEKTTNQTGR